MPRTAQCSRMSRFASVGLIVVSSTACIDATSAAAAIWAAGDPPARHAPGPWRSFAFAAASVFGITQHKPELEDWNVDLIAPERLKPHAAQQRDQERARIADGEHGAAETRGISSGVLRSGGRVRPSANAAPAAKPSMAALTTITAPRRLLATVVRHVLESASERLFR
jgi:hypothetical protein